MDLQKAIKLLEQEYERAQKMCFVRNPLAWALYRVWKKADGQKDWDEDCIRDCKNCWKTKLANSQWIPVTERLPEEGDRYLCRVKSFAFPGSFYQSLLRYDKYGFQDGGVYEEGVTHWMPLPPAPKGE